MKEKVKFWRVPELGNLELLRATYIKHNFTNHFHDGYGIGVILSGAQETEYNRSKRILPEGTVCVLNPGEVHNGHAFNQNGWTYRMFYPDISLLRGIAEQISEKKEAIPIFPELVIKDDRLFLDILNLHRSFEKEGTSLLERESGLTAIFGELINRHAEIKPVQKTWRFSSKNVKNAREYLDAHFADETSLNDLAAFVQLSPWYLLRLFKKETGVTPYVYVTHRRVNIARKLLTAGSSVAETAYKTGFADQSHLTNRFRSIVGITPGKFRQANGIINNI